MHFDDSLIDDKINGEVLWEELDRVLLAAPLLCLARLGDTAGSTLRKLPKAVLWCNEKFEVMNKMSQVGDDGLKSLMYQCWLGSMEEFQSPITDAAYVLDPQWINESRNADAAVMENFWTIAKEILCKGRHKGVQRQAWKGEGEIETKTMTQLQVFRFRTGAFARSVGSCDYNNPDCVCFWTTYGYCVLGLTALALAITPLPCGSGCAEQNWAACKSVLNKKQNRIAKAKMGEIVFVRTWLRL